MNWKEINKKYPKAIDKLCDWKNVDTQKEINDYVKNFNPKSEKTRFERFMHDHFIIPSYEGYGWNIRGLYDFFDEQGIYINLLLTKGIRYIPKLINNNKIPRIWVNCGVYKTRKQAEQAAFKQAFEILENKIDEVEILEKGESKDNI